MILATTSAAATTRVAAKLGGARARRRSSRSSEVVARRRDAGAFGRRRRSDRATRRRASEGENETTEPSPSSASDEEAKAEELRETLKATEKEVSSPSGGPARFGDVDLKGGKYGFGERIDDALDATTNPDAFLIGGFALVIGAAILFALGPRPPSDYYGY
jgi:hypothetical protein